MDIKYKGQAKTRKSGEEEIAKSIWLQINHRKYYIIPISEQN